jgi:hypothetical protein
LLKKRTVNYKREKRKLLAVRENSKTVKRIWNDSDQFSVPTTSPLSLLSVRLHSGHVSTSASMWRSLLLSDGRCGVC